MTSILLMIAYLGCVSSGAMLSMLLLLIAAYVSAAIWLVVHGAVYSGLLYVLVYVGAIVVLIMFVVQLTNTSLTVQNTHQKAQRLVILQNTVLVFSLSFLLISAYSLVGSELVFHMSSFHLDRITVTDTIQSISTMSNYAASLPATNNLVALASSLFNEYLYVLLLSVHAIVLAVIGPIKLALADYQQPS